LNYILREYHREDVFAIKFYTTQHKHSDYRYNKLVNRGYALNIFRTCLDVVVQLLEQYPYASFVVSASRSIDPLGKFTENAKNNKRFRIYSKFIAQQDRIGDVCRYI